VALQIAGTRLKLVVGPGALLVDGFDLLGQQALQVQVSRSCEVKAVPLFSNGVASNAGPVKGTLIGRLAKLVMLSLPCFLYFAFKIDAFAKGCHRF
jgi:hypothetical protein